MTSPASARPGPISDEAVEAVIVKTLETTPKGETHWSTRTMAAKAGHESHDGRPDLAHVWAQTAHHARRSRSRPTRSSSRRCGMSSGCI